MADIGATYANLLAQSIRETLGDHNDDDKPVVILVMGLLDENKALKAEVNTLNNLLRDIGLGRGEIDTMAALEQEVARLRSSNEMLEATTAKGCLALMDAKSGPRWIPVSERLPERKPELVLVARGTLIMQKAVLTLLRDAEGERYWTHWQYMPPAPEGG